MTPRSALARIALASVARPGATRWFAWYPGAPTRDVPRWADPLYRRNRTPAAPWIVSSSGAPRIELAVNC